MRRLPCRPGLVGRGARAVWARVATVERDVRGFAVVAVLAGGLGGWPQLAQAQAQNQAQAQAQALSAVLPAAEAGAAEPQPTAAVSADAEAGMRADSRRYIVLAVDNPLHHVPRRAGTSLPPYAAPPRYGVGAQAAGTLAALLRDHALAAVAAWPIRALGVQCVVVTVPDGTPRDTLLQRLSADPRVRLAQPLQDFQLMAQPSADTDVTVYNDPYVPLQRGFADLAAARAHRVSTGRDVAGVIAATGNNGLGIVGVAPQARLWLYRACWYAAGGARCNSFTLAKALAAVLEGPARVLNLSLAGPADPLLGALLHKAQQQRRIVVAALPASGRREGFPAGLPGVVVAGTAGTALPPGVLPAPGRDVLTLAPGARFDYASGSSLAAAHTSGVAALLLAAAPGLDADHLQALLTGQPGTAGEAAVTTVLNAEQALLRLSRGQAPALLRTPR